MEWTTRDRLEYAINSAAKSASVDLNEISPWSIFVVGLQSFFFCLLVVATHYRKEWSSNSEYRKRIRSRRSKDLRPTLLDSNLYTPLDDLSKLDEIFGTEDIIVRIVEFLGMGDVEHLFGTSSTIHFLLSNEIVWKKIFVSRHGYIWENDILTQIRYNRGISFDPRDDACPTPAQGWRNFMTDFEYAYVDWLLAGHNRPDACYLHIDKEVLDVSLFLPAHPGSPETLLDHSGIDATDVFYDIGHSELTRTLRGELCVLRTRGTDFSRQFRSYEKGHAGEVLVFPSRVAALRKHRRLIMAGVVGVENLVSRDPKRFFANSQAGSPASKALVLSGTCPASIEGKAHGGAVRPFYDPLEQEWYGWWSCCGACATADASSDGEKSTMTIARRLLGRKMSEFF